MYACDYKTLTLEFNVFHGVETIDDLPAYGTFCLLELKDGGYTAGSWSPADISSKKTKKKKAPAGQFIRGLADTVPLEDVVRWHRLEGYDISECLENEEIHWINFLDTEEEVYTAEISGFLSTRDGDFPKNEQYCLLILNDGSLSGGRWEDGRFEHASAGFGYDPEEVWAWAPLSPDRFFLMEQEEEQEKAREAEMNRHPSIDPELLKYGTDIGVYYEKALEKLRERYYWASPAMMKKPGVWEIVPNHGRLVFAQVDEGYRGDPVISEWTEGTTADEFIDFLCTYAENSVKDSNPEERFKFGLDITVYLEKAFKEAKKKCPWLTKKLLKDAWTYDIQKVDGDWEFVRKYGANGEYDTMYAPSAEHFLENVAHEYESEALRANEVVDSYNVPFGHVEIHGWYLEHYIFMKLRTGDYKVSVQAGDRVTGGTREFFITRDCFKAPTYAEFLDRYLEIVSPTFGLGKKDLLADEKLKKFLGYTT